MSENTQTHENSAQNIPPNPFAGLKKPVDPNLIKQREGWRDKNGNPHMVDFIEWHAVADILDAETPGWTHTVKDIREIGDILTVTVAITISGITREGIGTGAAGSEVGIKKAEHDALKRAAVKFGVARELYKKESDLIETSGSLPSNDSAAPTNPVARSQSDLCSAKQLGMIRSLAREKSVDPQTVCGEIWQDANLDELSKRAASYLITRLQELSESINSPTEVRTGIPESEPAKSVSETNVRQMPAAAASTSPAPPVNQIAPSTPAREDAADGMRREIVDRFNEIKQSADQSLAAFDYERDLAKKQGVHRGIMNFVVQVKREQITEALAASGWDQNETDGELAKFGIDEGLRKGSAEQINRMWANYRRDKQL